LNIQFIILLEILYFFNKHAIFTTMMSRIIFLPLAIFNLDGFKYSENRLIHRWQKYNNVFVIILLLIFLMLIIGLDTFSQQQRRRKRRAFKPSNSPS
jgi:predicted Na+-dependent transporter